MHEKASDDDPDDYRFLTRSEAAKHSKIISLMSTGTRLKSCAGQSLARLLDPSFCCAERVEL